MEPTQEILEVHVQACLNEEAGYIDPKTGLFVLTSHHLRERGYCCGNGCRHCPFGEDDWKEAGRPDVAAYPYP